jgi:hypothetical protein
MQFLLIGCYLVDVNFQSNVYVMILLTVFQVLTMLRSNLMHYKKICLLRQNNSSCSLKLSPLILFQEICGRPFKPSRLLLSPWFLLTSNSFFQIYLQLQFVVIRYLKFQYDLKFGNLVFEIYLLIDLLLQFAN